MPFAAIYARVSTEDQARHGYSLADQRRGCRERLVNLGYTEIKEYVDDGYSGEFLERPAMDRLREDLRAKIIDVVIAYDPDRLSRNLTNQLLLADEIEKSGVKLMFVTGDYDCSPEGRLFFSMRGAISAFEKAKIRERTLRGKRAKALQQKIVINNHPFGFDWDADNSIYVINETEAALVRLIYDLCLDNHWGGPQITSELINRGLTRRGKPWNPVAVYRIMRKELYSGVAYSCQISTTKTGQHSRATKKRPREEWIPIPVPEIVPRDKWEQVQRIIEENKTLSRRNTKSQYLLRGLIRCGICGMGMTASVMKQTGRIRSYYRCITKTSPRYRRDDNRVCINRYIPARPLEETIWNAIVDIARGKLSIDGFVRIKKRPDHTKEIRDLSHQIEELHRKRNDIIKWYTANLIDSRTAESELQTINKEMSANNTRLSDLRAAESQKNSSVNFSPIDIINASTIEQQRKALIQLGLKVYVRRVGKDTEFWFEPK